MPRISDYKPYIFFSCEEHPRGYVCNYRGVNGIPWLISNRA